MPDNDERDGLGPPFPRFVLFHGGPAHLHYLVINAHPPTMPWPMETTFLPISPEELGTLQSESDVTAFTEQHQERVCPYRLKEILAPMVALYTYAEGTA